MLLISVIIVHLESYLLQSQIRQSLTSLQIFPVCKIIDWNKICLLVCCCDPFMESTHQFCTYFPWHFCHLQPRTSLHRISCGSPDRFCSEKTKTTFVLLLQIIYHIFKILVTSEIYGNLCLYGICWCNSKLQ